GRPSLIVTMRNATRIAWLRYLWVAIRPDPPDRPWALRLRPSQVDPNHLKRLASAVPGASKGLTGDQLLRVATVAGARHVSSAGGENIALPTERDFERRTIAQTKLALGKLGFRARIELHFPDGTYPLNGPNARDPRSVIRERFAAAGKTQRKLADE